MADSATRCRAPATPVGAGSRAGSPKYGGWEADPNAYIYFITQAAVWPAICKVIGEEGWIT